MEQANVNELEDSLESLEDLSEDVEDQQLSWSTKSCNCTINA